MTAPQRDPFATFAATVGPADPHTVSAAEDLRDHGDPDSWAADRAADRYEAMAGWGR